ncbi:MAG: lysophospholipase, partial [Anaerolineae bacterium]|nr:lysophospholipase [Anaerolineae bacterium]
MANLARLQTRVRDFHGHLPTGGATGRKPVVVLLHGLGGDRNDWMSPFRERNWPYDHRKAPEEIDLGTHRKPPLTPLPGIQTQLFLSPKLASNSRGADGSDDRSWWQALVRAGFPTFTYSQVGDLMVPFSRGPVAEFKAFMRNLQEDVLGDDRYRGRPAVLLGHSRGGLIARAYLGDAEVKGDQAGRFPVVRGLIT